MLPFPFTLARQDGARIPLFPTFGGAGLYLARGRLPLAGCLPYWIREFKPESPPDEVGVEFYACFILSRERERQKWNTSL